MTALTNTLSGETSPHLQSHSTQPVQWQTWRPETLALAKQHNKPILLSIGFSACRWCHLMARESFQDPETAALMNEFFINVKVDREERPDLDGVYQTAHHLLTGRSGGWPLTVFLCPQTQLPFFAGTFFPKIGQENQLGFDDLLNRVQHYYGQQQADFLRLRGQVESSFQQLTPPAASVAHTPEVSLLDEALTRLAAGHDLQDGGFGSSPKFPLPVNLAFLLQLQARQGLPVSAREHLLQTLNQIAQRGINDRIGGGFYRYSTDSGWNIPHFEKMLYDNGLLLDVYARAWLTTDNPLYKSAAIGIVRWLRQHMLTPHGAFFSAMDAETAGREGDYYTLSEADIKAQLSVEEFLLFQQMFALRGQPNFFGRWHLSQQQDLNTAARQLSMTRETALELYRAGREKIESLRIQRPLPLIDEKVLTGWNALAVKGLLVLARKNNELRELALAQGTLDFIRNNLWLNNRLFAAWQGERPTRHAYLDDYVYLMDALLESLQTQWRDVDYQFVIALAESLLRLYEDTDQGGFFYTAHDAETLIYRSKPFMDSALPAANGVAAKVLLRLGHLTAEPRYLQSVQKLLSAALPSVQQSPETHLTLLQAQMESQHPMPQVLLLDNGSMAVWEQDVRQNFCEQILCYRIPESAELYPTEALSMDVGDALVCTGDHCLEVQRSCNGIIHQLTELLQRS
ncbi:thioredoxin domain-containing protein [Aestuariicella hydrocarbonica]|uniref:Thioredoxin domain-containing protein n=1 Tax=Pseudomaricurvus hydrocarbonicus TaxID=1470433 RepID=A0A9E5JS75_9GAMM|nr:thioredoxin domain-containing protein [Aestuariicella hydrocarbonica]NHO64354.1 thioredoxin domain-containing protein [Aestuariicella hydrocarbonica]